jgi:hypothetical protein
VPSRAPPLWHLFWRPTTIVAANLFRHNSPTPGHDAEGLEQTRRRTGVVLARLARSLVVLHGRDRSVSAGSQVVDAWEPTAHRHVMLYGRDSWTQHWHDSLDPGWKLKFRCRLPCASSGSAMQSQPTASHRRRRQHTDYSYVDAEYPQARSPSPPKSPRRFRLLTNACPLCLLAKLA